jgi:endonuclease-8
VPEGDTIHRAAARLRPALAGREVRRFRAPRLAGDRPKVGARIEEVEAVGKHLLVHFEGGLTLQTHMRMTGSWHLYRPGERWQKAPRLARVTIEVDDWVAVCFAAPIVRTFHREGRSTSDPTAHLGPDLCRADLTAADIEECLRRMAACTGPDDEIGAVLLDQRVACGVGNVYKSEVLFACGVDPFAVVVDLDVDTRRRLVTTASRLLRANLGTGPRTTVAGGLAVYGRTRQACLRCGTTVRSRRQGEQARSTYWCPTCQPPRPVQPAPPARDPT